MVSIIPYPYDLYGIFRFYRADYVPNYLRLPQLFDSGIFKGVFRHPPLTIARQRQA